MKLLYFAWLRQKIGVAEERIDPPQEIVTVAALIEWLRGRGPNFSAALAESAVIRVAVNQEYVPWTHPVRAGDEVAFFPPMTGG